jgi:tRNA(Ile)-lysidine synthase
VSLLLATDELVKRKKLRLRVVVAHLNHKLRDADSDADEKFVRAIADKLGYEFVAASARIPRMGNLEQNARDARYKFLAKTARQHEALTVLTGHTQNDQAETFLLNLIRGSGTDGLAAMDTIRELDKGILLARPLISWATREDTENFCKENGVEYRNDRMNNDTAFTRVRIRKSILPMLREINPRIVETLARTSFLIRHGDGGKGRDESEKGKKGEGEKRGIELSGLRSLAKGDRYEAIREWLRTSRGSLRGLNLKHIESVERLILSQKSGKTVELPGGGRVVKSTGRLTFDNIRVEK